MIKLDGREGGIPVRKVLSVGLFLLSTPAMGQEDVVDKRYLIGGIAFKLHFSFRKPKRKT
jgi:hypothetical protein